MEITQEERLDLKKEQVKEEMKVYDSKFSDWCEVFGFDQKKLMEEYYHDVVLNSEEYKKLEAENQRLKKQLDREIHINRKMKKVLKEYANKYCWYRYGDDGLKIVFRYASHNGYDSAQQVLKEIDNKE